MRIWLYTNIKNSKIVKISKMPKKTSRMMRSEVCKTAKCVKISGMTAYETYTVEKKAQLAEQIKKNKLQADLECISMVQVMRIFLYIPVKNTRSSKNCQVT